MDREDLFPPRPVEPLESECCGGGCNPCVFDIYRAQVVQWEKQCSAGLPGEAYCAFTPFVLQSLCRHTHDTFLYSFRPERVERPPHVRPGQHLIMRSGGDTTLTRAYTPISTGDMGQFETLIKIYKGGRMSCYISSLKQNDVVEWRGPYGDFQYVPNAHRHVVMLCAGTGLAPMYSIARSIVEDESDESLVRLLFACRDFQDILLRDELQKLALFWNFSAEIFLSRAELPVENQLRYGESVTSGRIGKQAIDKELVNKRLEQVRVLICGTKSFNKDMVNYVKQVGVPDDNVYLF